MKQDTFDRVARHLLQQKEPAKLPSSSACAYRAPDGKTCAIGCLIPDSEYTPNFEGATIRGRDDLRYLMLRLGHDIELLVVLQSIHDLAPPESWPRLLCDAARRFDVINSVIGAHV